MPVLEAHMPGREQRLSSTPGKPEPIHLVVHGYWVIVRRGLPELLELLEQSFDDRALFYVIEDRRRSSVQPTVERRGNPQDWVDQTFQIQRRKPKTKTGGGPPRRGDV
jgi:hypothetical protein